MNHSQFYNQVYKRDNPEGEETHGWIQWKGTDVCMDIHCECGHHGHIDVEFFYFFECPQCHAKYAVGQNVKFIKLTEEEANFVEIDHMGFKTCELDED